jgi:predicted PurR-regulated permease PerM
LENFTRSPDVATQRLVRAVLITLLIAGIGAIFAMTTAVFDRVHNTLVVVIFSILFSYVVYPPIKWLANRRVPIAIGGVVVYAVLAVVVLGAIAWLAPAVASQAESLSHQLPTFIAETQKEIANPSQVPLLAKLPASARETIAKNAGKAGEIASGLVAGVGTHAVGILAGTTAGIVDIALVLGMTLLIVGDLANLQAFGIRIVPRAHRAAAIAFAIDVGEVIGGFVRGQVALALGVAAIGSLILAVLGVPYAILLGLVAGIVSIVPLIGIFIAIVPVIIVAFFTVGLVKMIIVAVLFGVLLLLQQNVFTPLVNSHTVGVTQLVIFLALLFGSESFGVLGALLAIPIAGILRVAAERLFPHDEQSQAILIAARASQHEPVRETREAIERP